MQYDQYQAKTPQVSQTANTDAVKSDAPVQNLQAADDAQKPIHDPDEFFKNAGVSEAPIPPGQRLVKREERIEYRDQDGNTLNEEQVKGLEGKVEFKTRYETRTRMLNDAGEEVEDVVDADVLAKAGVAPPHPDVEGLDTQTVQGKRDESVPPAKESVEGDHEARAKQPKPASGGNEASVTPS